jgi:MoaA/NifB/PqqE/SkfB family radical SAM enzyme
MSPIVRPIEQKAMTGLRKWYAFGYLAVRMWAHLTRTTLVRERSPRRYFTFLRRLTVLLKVLWHNKVMRINGTYKFEIYLPAFPTPAFFHAIKKYDPATREPAALTVVLSMTKACAYQCPHCYQRMDQGKEVEIELLRRVAREMQDMGVTTFDIEGGEPMLRFDRLCELLTAFDERAEIWVNTTGDGLTRERAEQLRRLGVFGVYVSIHSADAATHDAFTGKQNAFGIACEAVTCLQDVGIATAINYCASPEDVRGDGVRRLFALARELGCSFVQVIHGKSAGGWLDKPDAMISESPLIDKLAKLHVEYNGSLRYRDYPAVAVQVFEESHDVFGCTAGGVDRFYVNHEGEVQPCEFINVSFGNIKDEPFIEIFRRMRGSFETPGSDWLCCTQAPGILAMIKTERLAKTPIPKEHTQKLVALWNKGQPTPLYRTLGIYPGRASREKTP